MWRVVFKEGGGRKGGASSYLRKRSGWRVISFRKGGWCSYQFLALIAFPSTKTPLKLPNHFPLIIFLPFSELRYCRLIFRRWGKAGKWCRDWLIINSIDRYWTFLSQTLPIIANHCPTHVMKLCSLKSSTQRCVSKIKAEKEDQHNELILSSLSRTWQYGYF